MSADASTAPIPYSTRPIPGAVTRGAVFAGEVSFKNGLWGKDGFSFGDLVDIVNPLQHLPVVGTIYRELTGDELSPASRIAGGGLFGGLIGLGVSLVNALIEDSTGRDVGGHVVAALFGDGEADSAPPSGPVIAHEGTPPAPAGLAPVAAAGSTGPSPLARQATALRPGAEPLPPALLPVPAALLEAPDRAAADPAAHRIASRAYDQAAMPWDLRL